MRSGWTAVADGDVPVGVGRILYRVGHLPRGVGQVHGVRGVGEVAVVPTGGEGSCSGGRPAPSTAGPWGLGSVGRGGDGGGVVEERGVPGERREFQWPSVSRANWVFGLAVRPEADRLAGRQCRCPRRQVGGVVLVGGGTWRAGRQWFGQRFDGPVVGRGGSKSASGLSGVLTKTLLALLSSKKSRAQSA